MKKEIDLGAITAYGDARVAGYDGTYEDFCRNLAALSANKALTSYLQLSNKPRINGIELVGNLTSEDLGLRTLGSRVEITTPSVELYGQKVTLTDGVETEYGYFDNNGACVFPSVRMGGVLIASATLNGKTCYAYVKCPYFTNYKTELVWSDANVYSFIIDHTDYSVSYDDAASGMKAGGENWLINEPFINIRPCVLNSGNVKTYLQREAFFNDGEVKDLSGNTVSLDTDDEVMVEFPKLGIRADWMDEDRLKISLTTGDNVPGFDYTAYSAHKYNDASKMLIGVESETLSAGADSRYYTGNTPPIVTNLINSGKSKGEGYYIFGFSQRQILVALYMLFNMSIETSDDDFLGIKKIVKTGSAEAQAGFLTPKSSTTSGKSIMVAKYADAFTGLGYATQSSMDSDLLSTHHLIGDATITGTTSNYGAFYMAKPIGDNKAIFIPKTVQTGNTPYGYWYGYSGNSYPKLTLVGTYNHVAAGFPGDFYGLSSSHRVGSSSSNLYYTYGAKGRQMFLSV